MSERNDIDRVLSQARIGDPPPVDVTQRVLTTIRDVKPVQTARNDLLLVAFCGLCLVTAALAAASLVHAPPPPLEDPTIELIESIQLVIK